MRIQLSCGADGRRSSVKESPLNGIDYLELISTPSVTQLPLILLRFFKPVTDLCDANILIQGGTRPENKNIKIAWAQRADQITHELSAEEKKIIDEIKSNLESEYFMVIRPSNDGDFSKYRLLLVSDFEHPECPPPCFDQILSGVDFTFKPGCNMKLDCKDEKLCPPTTCNDPVIDYMAKDYASFRLLMRSRLASIMPEWKESSPADLGIVLLEILAYVGDHLSYYQDSVATEAYLGTARRRISAKRHARLFDYFIQEGCNARAWVCFQVDKFSDGSVIPSKTLILTGDPNEERILVNEKDLEEELKKGTKAFQTMHEIKLLKDHNEIYFYTWGDAKCCLPKGATRATLKNSDNALKIQVGDVLLFEEIRSPDGGEYNEDPSHKHFVRLREVTYKTDELNCTPIIDIAWDKEDALPFPLCLWEIQYSRTGDTEPVSVARGNTVLVDHGYEIPKERLTTNSASRKYRPTLSLKPLTFCGSYDGLESAHSALNYKIWNVKPSIYLVEEKNYSTEERLPDNDTTVLWEAVNDLLSSNGSARQFVPEVENDGTIGIRFGDNYHGMHPVLDEKSSLYAVYRIGNGSEGNVGANTITRILYTKKLDLLGIKKIWNPMAATGGTDPENLESIRRDVPHAFRSQLRAVIESDYPEALRNFPDVQRAAVFFRWTGSWYTVFVIVDRVGGLEADEDFKKGVAGFLDKYRLAGYDLEVVTPVYVPLEIEMTVCTDEYHYNSKVENKLREVFSNQDLLGGGKGFFHPDNLSFGEPVFLSRIYEFAMTVDGVGSVTLTKFRPRGRDTDEIDIGWIEVGDFEIARLDNDPNFPEHGTIKFDVRGGK